MYFNIKDVLIIEEDAIINIMADMSQLSASNWTYYWKIEQAIREKRNMRKMINQQLIINY